MTAREYLNQVGRLDLFVKSNLKELDYLRDLASSVRSPGFDERVQTSAKNEGPFVRSIEKIMTLEKKVNDQLETLMRLREQVYETIEGLDDPDERAVLTLRYLQNCTWTEIGQELDVDERTIRRWHMKALSDVVLPVNPIVVRFFHND